MSQIRTNSIVPSEGVPAGASGGGIIQCVQTSKTDVYSASLGAATETGDVTGFTATITPRSTSNKILVMVTAAQAIDSNNAYLRLYRGGTILSGGVGDTSGTRVRVSASNYGSGTSMDTSNFTYIDSPASTSALTYSVRFWNPSSITRTFYLNADSSNSYVRGFSSIILMEVSG